MNDTEIAARILEGMVWEQKKREIFNRWPWNHRKPPSEFSKQARKERKKAKRAMLLWGRVTGQ